MTKWRTTLIKKCFSFYFTIKGQKHFFSFLIKGVDGTFHNGMIKH